MRRLTILDAQKDAEKKGGECLSRVYVNNRTKLTYKCKKEHIWETAPGNVRSGRWCPTCAIENNTLKKRKTIEDMQRLAAAKLGRCLSTVYVNSRTPLLWQCRLEHVWSATPGSAISGKWCPFCAKGTSERVCREFFERLFNNKFPASRPDWLKGLKGKKLELDGFCKELNLAFEYQGAQHFNDKIFYMSKKGKLKERMKLDLLKKELCKKHRVTLIEVPYTIKYKDMKDFIINACKEKGIEVPNRLDIIDYTTFNVNPPDILQELIKIARSKGGDCLSKRYIDSQTKLKWKCRYGHIWLAPSTAIKSGQWCLACSGSLRHTLDDVREWTKVNGGKCLAKEYKNANTKLPFQCKKGHLFEARPATVRKGHWCPSCAGNKKLTLEAIQELAKSRGGKCLATEYKNVDTKLPFQCERGHIWEAIPFIIIKGHWCPKCAGVAKYTIDDMRDWARNKEGECLSTVYLGIDKKLKWRCKKGHIWEATPHSIKAHWCPTCAILKNTKH